MNMIIAGLLSDMMVLRHKTHVYHWNIVGITFPELHKMFQTQYETLLLNADRLAEFMKTEEMEIPVSMKEMLEQTKIKEAGEEFDAETILTDLYHDNKLLKNLCIEIGERLSPRQNVLSNILADFTEYHAKQSWFLKSILNSM